MHPKILAGHSNGEGRSSVGQENTLDADQNFRNYHSKWFVYTIIRHSDKRREQGAGYSTSGI